MDLTVTVVVRLNFVTVNAVTALLKILLFQWRRQVTLQIQNRRTLGKFKTQLLGVIQKGGKLMKKRIIKV